MSHLTPMLNSNCFKPAIKLTGSHYSLLMLLHLRFINNQLTRASLLITKSQILVFHMKFFILKTILRTLRNYSTMTSQLVSISKPQWQVSKEATKFLISVLTKTSSPLWTISRPKKRKSVTGHLMERLQQRTLQPKPLSLSRRSTPRKFLPNHLVLFKIKA